ncbi:energy-coupling factor ABC transporter ATP-binding protein [Enterococcus sp. HY326]|uniref:energy-coupling factor ABC transporter ATP-binding protein n=1 Tax=Enterococcus sp. HY326 TaxID=2971265 RepID=UPI00223F01BC|nr:ATP-binding cassette domain-containing protein [Enterococcus sp. HY326]
MENIIEISNLSYRYNQSSHRSLDSVSFNVKRGEFLAIIGPNASGKSTLCNALVGLIPYFFVGAKEGKVLVNGKNVDETDISDLSAVAGLVFQNPFNQLSYTTETVAEELAYGLGNRGVAREEMLKKIDEVAKRISLTDLLNQNPLELSGGQVQRVAFGSTFILEPQILVLDEFTTQLDPRGSDELMQLIKSLNQEGVTIIIVDHDMERVAKYANRVLVLNEGRVMQIGTPREVFTKENAKKYQIDLPEFVKLSYLLKEKNYWQGEIAFTEKEALNMLKEIKLC